MKQALIFSAAIAAVLLTFGAEARAGVVSPISYSMTNGDYGYVAGYGDNAYNNSSCPGFPGLLCGGLGELTDGITSPTFGGGDNHVAMVGWGSGPGSSHTIDFFFSPSYSFSQVAIHFSNYSPAAIDVSDLVEISIGGNTAMLFVPVPDEGDTGNQWFTFDTAGATGSTVQVKIWHGSYQWVFLDEVTFESADAVPEPGSWAMMLGACGLFAIGRKRLTRS